MGSGSVDDAVTGGVPGAGTPPWGPARTGRQGGGAGGGLASPGPPRWGLES